MDKLLLLADKYVPSDFKLLLVFAGFVLIWFKILKMLKIKEDADLIKSQVFYVPVLLVFILTMTLTCVNFLKKKTNYAPVVQIHISNRIINTTAMKDKLFWIDDGSISQKTIQTFRANTPFKIIIFAMDDAGLKSLSVNFHDAWHHLRCDNEKYCYSEVDIIETKPGSYSYSVNARDNSGKMSLDTCTVRIE
jgi:hypothetical protein